jgi:hypothetical protein
LSNSLRIVGWYSHILNLSLSIAGAAIGAAYLRRHARQTRRIERKSYVRFLIPGGAAAMAFSVLWFFLMLHAFPNTELGAWLFFIPTLGSGVVGIIAIGKGIYLKSVE